MPITEIKKDVELWIRFWRLITLSIGLAMIYIIIPGKVWTTPFWVLIFCYTFGAIITWTQRPSGKLKRSLIFVFLESIIIIYALPMLNPEDTPIVSSLVLIVAGYFLTSLYAELIIEKVISQYDHNIRRYVPECVRKCTDKFVQLISYLKALNPLGILIYLGSTLAILPYEKHISRPIETILLDINTELELIKNYLVDLLPIYIVNPSSWIWHHIFLPIIVPSEQYVHLDSIIYFLSIIILFIVALIFQVFFNMRIHWFINRLTGYYKNFLNIEFYLIYSIIIAIMILFFIREIINHFDTSLSFFIFIPLIISFAIWISDYIDINFGKTGISYTIRTSTFGFTSKNIGYNITIKPKTELAANIVLAIDCSESMYAIDPRQSMRKKAIKDIINFIKFGPDDFIIIKFLNYLIKFLKAEKNDMRMAIIYWSDKGNINSCKLTNDFKESISFADRMQDDNIPATDFDSALITAINALDNSTKPVNRDITNSVLIITDGQRDCGGINGYNLRKDGSVNVARSKGYPIYIFGIKVPPNAKNDLLEIERAQAGKCYFIEEPQDLSSALIDSIKTISYKLIAKEAMLELKLPRFMKDPTNFYPDRSLLDLNFINNIDNTMTIIWRIGEIRSGQVLKLRFDMKFESPRGFWSLLYMNSLTSKLICKELQ